MHYSLEIVMPPVIEDSLEEAVDGVMTPFSENNEDASHPFYDWYVIGGRWSGAKLESRIGTKVIEEFYEWLKEEGVTVSSVQCGKHTLSPADQIPKVDAKWREMTGLDGPCLIFDHSSDRYGPGEGDVCTVKELSDTHTVSHVIVTNAEGKADFMIQQSMWNGVGYVDTEWDGNVREAINMAIEHMGKYRTGEYQKKNTPTDDWIVVTVDYHS